ncbi:Spondin-1 [Halotydeus destructor]|nr:Spondin-1 [Halotydeus destructor]
MYIKMATRPPLTLVLAAILVLVKSTQSVDPVTPNYGRYQNSLHCNREPRDTQARRTPGDSGFKIKISGNPERYTPGEVYTVILQGYTVPYTVQKFLGFMLTVEPRDTIEPQAGQLAPQLPNVGQFQLYGDALTKVSDECPNGVVHASTIPKSEIQVMWQSPSPGSGCVVFKATIIEQRDVWYMDDGGLTKVLCEEEIESFDEQPEILEECCACDEAKYELIFEGLWSKYTHPKDFPANFWLTHFSDIIGASHSADFRMWEYGGYASDGLRHVAEMGVTKKLEAELKMESSKIRTIVKARGLWYPNLNGKTFAVFRVDRKNHLMSMISMLGPSPDWIVGVSGLELCLKNCSWANEKVMNLYLWDAGTDTGISYLSPNQPTIPQERIRKITSSNPSNPESPFLDTTGQKMKPFARLTVTRQRIYEKPCDEEAGESGHPRNPEMFDPDEDKPECQVTDWTDWEPCSVQCGQGVRLRRRLYVHPSKASQGGCDVPLLDKENCDVECVGEVSCSTTGWSNWSECSTTCGKGYRTRTRLFVNRAARKVCTQVDLVEREPCAGAVEECPESEETDPRCETTPWSDWSPCTATCGKGVRARQRYYTDPASIGVCSVELMQQVACMADKVDCTIEVSEAREICTVKPEVGPCRGYNPKWYWDVQKGMCLQFVFGGCRGNKNNFEKIEECQNTCEQVMKAPISALTAMDSRGFSGRPSYATGSSSGSSSSVRGSDQPVIDCVVTDWGPWSECSRPCGRAQKSRRRMIKLHPQNGGKLCPTKLVQRRRCKENPPCPRDCTLSDWSEWSECSVACGDYGITSRTRQVTQESRFGGADCGPKVERTFCTGLPPCDFPIKFRK